MNFGIDQATVGYDKQGLQQVINNLNTNVFLASQNVIRASLPEVREAIDSCWQGQSAIAFKNRLDKDSQTMIDALSDLKDQCETQIWQIAKNIDNYDAALAESIKSGN